MYLHFEAVSSPELLLSTDGCPFSLKAQYVVYYLCGPGHVFKCDSFYTVCKTLCILKYAVEYMFALQNNVK